MNIFFCSLLLYFLVVYGPSSESVQLSERVEGEKESAHHEERVNTDREDVDRREKMASVHLKKQRIKLAMSREIMPLVHIHERTSRISIQLVQAGARKRGTPLS